ncbi:MAG TPA: hypothetical protein VG939_03640 [Caulobacteraceae bacterium]|nr:hypothetical protein [Caulobacteraceae bacterium]
MAAARARASHWTTHDIGSSLYDRTFTAETRSILAVGSYYLHDVVVSYDVTNFTARFGVNNLADTSPPYPTVSPGVYDEIGRYFFVGLNARV